MNTMLGRRGLAAMLMTFSTVVLPALETAAGPHVRLDDALVQVQVQVQLPGFGGMFLDEGSRTLYVYSTGPMTPAAAVKELAAVAPAIAEKGLRVRVLRGAYTFAQLSAWRTRMTEVLTMPGVVLTDVDEARNRLKVGVASKAARAAVRVRLAELGVPLEAVDVVTTPPVQLQSTLQDFHRPLLGGLQVAFPRSDGAQIFCTYGFTATRPGVTPALDIDGFVTSAHCVTGLAYQPFVAPELLVGFPSLIPPFFTGGSCPEGRQCRYSDAAFVTFIPGITGLQAIARTDIGSNVRKMPNFSILRERNPIAGEAIQSVGSASGRSQGTVNATCVDVNVDVTDEIKLTFLCQGIGSYAAAPGDSGAPVFDLLPRPPQPAFAALLGMHWASIGPLRVFSPIGNIQSPGELGPLANCAGNHPC